MSDDSQPDGSEQSTDRDDRFTLTRRKALGTLGAVGAGAAFTGGGTLALFSDTESSEGNVVTAGKLDLQIDWEEYYNGEQQETQTPVNNPGPIFELGDVKPGDHGEATISLDNKHNPAWVFVGGNLTTNTDHGVTEPEDGVAPNLDDSDGTGYGDLADRIMATVWVDDGDNELDSGEDVLAEGTLREVFAVLCRGVRFGEIAKDTKRHLGFKWELPKEVGNEVQGDEVAFDLLFHAQQTRHNPNPTNPFLPQPEKWLSEVPIPGTLDGTQALDISMNESQHSFHPDLPDTTVWGYNGGYLGPTIEAEKGTETSVTFTNDLPTRHLLPVDQSLFDPDGEPDVRTVTYLHGGNVEPEWDGWPEAWYTSDGVVGQGPGTPQDGQNKQTNVYANEQPASTLWYHDHAIGTTRLNVYAGLAGFYNLRDSNPSQAVDDLPSGEYEVPLVIQDKSFCNDGSLFYPPRNDADDRDPQFPNPTVVPEFFGDTAVVNGKVWPVMNVEPRNYRFRVLNGSDSRFYNLQFQGYDEQTGARTEPGSDGDTPAFTRIGTDGGFMNEVVDLESTDRLLLPNARRHDVVVNFSGFEGESFVLHNNAETPYAGANDGTDLPEIMLFRVGQSTSGTDTSSVPSSGGLATVPDLSDNVDSNTTHRYLTLDEGEDTFGRLEPRLNDTTWDQAVENPNDRQEHPTAGTTEVWHLINRTPDTHPIHLHLVQFQVYGRSDYDTADFESNYDGTNAETVLNSDGTYTPPSSPVEERAWYDTIDANPGQVTSIVMKFGEVDLGNGTTEFRPDLTGQYPWHCHILSHEDHDMMLPYTVE